ncbi:MAG: hypothetical protein M1269_12580 [Chloroflexi bacterium]|nr:hypothetical protein [Chloroflexota bacterium]
MFPLTHLFLLSKITELDDLAVLGSLFPDTCIAGHLSWDDTHRHGLEFAGSLQREEKRLLMPFLTGFFAHSVNPPGLDYYGDECMAPGKPGYSFCKAPGIVGEVVSACNLPGEMGLWKSHNVIEMAVEVRIARLYPELEKFLEQAFNSTENLSIISGPLGRHFGVSPGDIISAYGILQSFIPASLPDEVSLGAAFAGQLEHKHGIAGVSPVYVAGLIVKADSFIVGDYEEFLEDCLDKITMALPGWLGDTT